jgi:hypothetical protein
MITLGSKKCHAYTWGQFHQTFLPGKKVAGAQLLAKKLQFNFSNKVVRLKLCQNLPNYVRHLPNAVRKKKALNLAPEKNSRANVGEINPCCHL